MRPPQIPKTNCDNATLPKVAPSRARSPKLAELKISAPATTSRAVARRNGKSARVRGRNMLEQGERSGESNDNAQKRENNGEHPVPHGYFVGGPTYGFKMMMYRSNAKHFLTTNFF